MTLLVSCLLRWLDRLYVLAMPPPAERDRAHVNTVVDTLTAERGQR